MSRAPSKPTALPKQPANLNSSQIKLGISKLERRIADLEAFDLQQISAGDNPQLAALRASVDGTLESIFGKETTDYERYKVAISLDATSYMSYLGSDNPITARTVQVGVAAGINRSMVLLRQAVASLNETLQDSGETESGRALRAYEGLDLHPEIERAAGGLYRDGHYASAIEDAVKALNGLVRLRSGENTDGTALMELVFSPKRPILKFNDLNDESAINEQKGFMMMFSGAVSGLRNPRAHKLIKDDPERALEFIAFVSLLAKLLDGASK